MLAVSKLIYSLLNAPIGFPEKAEAKNARLEKRVTLLEAENILLRKARDSWTYRRLLESSINE